MPEAKINETCIIGLPTCGYAFSSSRMAFIACPSDEDFRLELDIIQGLLRDKDYEAYIALQQLDPARLAFCTKICSKIITSQFCIVLLNSSRHREHPQILIPNPNVHLEYGLMLAFKKHILPFQREGDALAFNIRPLDTIIYTNSIFKEKADRAIDGAILAAGTTRRPTRALASIEPLLKYLTVHRLKLSDVSPAWNKFLYQLGNALGFFLLDGEEFVFFGPFDQEVAKEVVLRVKLLLQNIHQAKVNFETDALRTLSADQAEWYRRAWSRVRVLVFISKEHDKDRISSRIQELTVDLRPTPWTLVNEEDLQETVKREYDAIGEI